MDHGMIKAMIAAKMQTGAVSAPPLVVSAPKVSPPMAPVVEPEPEPEPDRFAGLRDAYAGRHAGDVVRLSNGTVAMLRGWRMVAGAMVAVLVDASDAVHVVGRYAMATCAVLVPAGGLPPAVKAAPKRAQDTGGVKVGAPLPVVGGGSGGAMVGGVR